MTKIGKYFHSAHRAAICISGLLIPSSSALILMSICTSQCLFSHSFTTYEWLNRHCNVQIYIGITSRWTGYTLHCVIEKLRTELSGSAHCLPSSKPRPPLQRATTGHYCCCCVAAQSFENWQNWWKCQKKTILVDFATYNFYSLLFRLVSLVWKVRSFPLGNYAMRIYIVPHCRIP
jgi:hypothetical protein